MSGEEALAEQPLVAAVGPATEGLAEAEQGFLDQHLDEVLREGEPETRFYFAEAAAEEGQLLVDAGQLERAGQRFAQGSELLEPLVWRDAEEAASELHACASELYLILRTNCAKVSADRGDWVSSGQLARAVLELDPEREAAAALCSEAAEMLEASVWRSSRTGCDVVPMGHYCTTARFLELTGWRKQALPVDWCAATFKVWRHMLSDNFATLLAEPATGRHPYDSMFPDVLMFEHQRGGDGRAGWANSDVRRRVPRLQELLRRGSAFGLALYFEGQEESGAPLEEVVEDARGVLALEQGFQHIALVWLQESCEAAWEQLEPRLSVLRFSLFYPLPHGETLLPTDTVRLAELLEARFPDVFLRDTKDGGCSSASSEKDAELDEDWAGQRVAW